MPAETVRDSMGSDNLLLPGTNDPQQSSILDDPRQRRILSILRDRSEPVDLAELATELAAMEAEEERDRIRIDLRHRCLPKLESVGWIERRDRRVRAAEPLPFGAGSPLPALDELDEQFWDAVDVLVGYPRRQELLSAIGEQRYPRTLDGLVRELTDRDNSAWDEYDDESTVRTLLYHVDLPKLEDVGLVEYDRDEQQVMRTAFLMLLGNQIEPATGVSGRRASCGDERS